MNHKKYSEARNFGVFLVPVTVLDLHFLSLQERKYWIRSVQPSRATPHRGVAFRWVRVLCLSRISEENKDVQRELIEKHKGEMAAFLNSGEYRFFPEIVLSVSLLTGNNHSEVSKFLSAVIGKKEWNKKLGDINISIFNHDAGDKNRVAHITFDETKTKLNRIDGNHRLSAASEVVGDFKVPFCLILCQNPDDENRYSRAIFHNINAKQIPLDLEENLKVILGSTEVFSDDKLKTDPSFGWKYFLARKTIDTIDFTYFPSINSYISSSKHSFFVDLYGFLIKNKSVEENDSAIAMVKSQLVEVEQALIESEITATTTNIAVIGALAYYRLTNESKYRGFLSWIKKNNIGNVEKLHIDDVINLYDEIYEHVPKKVFLPHFDKESVKTVVDELQSNEGSNIPTEINGESLEEPTYVTWTVHTPQRNRQHEPDPNQLSIFDTPGGTEPPAVTTIPGSNAYMPVTYPISGNSGSGAPEYIPPQTVTLPVPSGSQHPVPVVPEEDIPQGTQLTFDPEIDRVEIIDFINAQGYMTYLVRKDRINDYLKSLLDLATLLTHNVIYQGARDEVIDDIVGLIRSYIDELHRTGKYDEMADQVLQFKLSVQVFDPFGNALQENYFNDFTLMSETDIDRQLRNADARLGRYGFSRFYGSRYFDEENPNTYKIDCVLFAADDACRTKLGEYAKKKLYEFARKYRLKIVSKSDACKKKYHDILADADVISEQLFAIPENICVREDPDGIEYENHLLVSPETGVAKFKFKSSWEPDLIEEESKRPGFVCWLRNPDRASWALCLPYEIRGETKSFYPDFLVIRRDAELDYIVDILEPHGDQYVDNLPKAKALAEYAKTEDRIGRIQLIRKGTDVGGVKKFKRLELTDLAVREKVLRAVSDDELAHIFDTDGIDE